MNGRSKRPSSRKKIPTPSSGVLAAAADERRRALEPVGVTETEERLYGLLLDHPGASLPELTDLAKLPRRKAQLVLSALELKGLVTHSPERICRYFPTPPDVAVEALILKQQEALQRVRAVAARLQEKARKARSASNADERVIEIITGRQVQSGVFVQIQRTAREEVIGFDRPPYIWSPISSPTSPANKTQFEAMAHGVRCRAVYDLSALKVPGAAERIRAYMESGEEARVFPDVPLKLVAADHRIAMLPLDLQHPEGAAVLLRPSSLLDALYKLFESIWQHAAPISFAHAEALKIGQAASPLPSDAEHLVPLLAAGLKDKAIAGQLGISQRTLDRRIRELMTALNACTRFQVGWLAALRRDSATS